MTGENKKWVTAWGNAVSVAKRRPASYAKNITLRYPIKMMLDGEGLRITLDNFCGTEAVTIASVKAARSLGEDRIDAATIKIFTFGGKESVTIPAGEKTVSDPVEFSVSRGEELAISIYLADYTEMRSGVIITGPLSRGYFGIGDQTEKSPFDMDTSKATSCFYFLSDIEVLTTEEKRTVICYGDSITAQAWPDFLMEKVLEAGITDTAVIRKAASGTRILRQYDNITYDSYGLKGKTRFPHETDVTGADTVIIQHGINDIIHPVGEDVNKFRPWSDLPTAEEMIDGLRWYIKLAQEKGLKVYLGTLLPIKGWRTYEDFREVLKNEVNEWIRTTDEADGFIDFDKAVCDPDDPKAFAEGYDSGDHLHPSLKAYERMAEEAMKIFKE